MDKSEIKIYDDNGEDYYYMDSHIKTLKNYKHCTLFPTEEQTRKMNLKDDKKWNMFCYRSILGMNTNYKIKYIFLVS